MKDAHGVVIYVGRAGSLKKRVASYFTKAHDAKTEALVAHIASINSIKTDSVLEATFKEAELIKKYQPKYNIEQKDDKSFMYAVITKDAYPRVLAARGRELEKTTELYQAVFGPFKSRDLLQSLLKLVRKIIPFSSCKPPANQKKSKPCFYYHLGECQGVCIGAITPREYKKIIKNLILFFSGKRKRVIANLVREMERLSKEENFESAARIRNQLYNLKHIRDVALIKKEEMPEIPFQRIEGYDVSNISGKYAVGSMVVFTRGEPDKKEYRKFKIKTVEGINDVKMLKEILGRRFTHNEWNLPDIIFIDGGVAQVNAGAEIARSMNFSVPIVGIAKGKTRKKVELIFNKEARILKKEIMELREIFARVRDEAHRFALSYHKKLRKGYL